MSWSCAAFWLFLIAGSLAIWIGTRNPKRRYRSWLKDFMERQ